MALGGRLRHGLSGRRPSGVTLICVPESVLRIPQGTTDVERLYILDMSMNLHTTVEAFGR